MFNIEGVFMRKYFGKLPIELKLKIMDNIDHWKIPPESKFTIYQSVKYKKEIIEKMKKNLNNSNIEIYGEMPFGKLRIDEQPFWNKKIKKWTYNYVYGIFNNHEGYATEDDIELYK